MSDRPSIAVARARAASRAAGPPLVDLHVHLEGTAEPALVERLAARNGSDVSRIIRDGRYVWEDFRGFLAAYDAAAAQFVTPTDYADLAHAYLTRIAAQGALYAEIFVSPDHAREAGLDPHAYLGGVAEGLTRAERETGIVARLHVVGIRHLGPEAVEGAARFAVDTRHPAVTGFGLAGDERTGEAADFARAFAIAREAGLGLTAHAGELCGPESVARTLDALRPDRIGHGVRAVENPALVERLANAGTVLEVCPGSNIALGLYTDMARHPLRQLVEAGVRVALGSDDPPFFSTDIAAEYRFAGQGGLDEARRTALTRTALEAAFLDETTRGDLQRRFTGAALAGGAAGAGEAHRGP